MLLLLKKEKKRKLKKNSKFRRMLQEFKTFWVPSIWLCMRVKAVLQSKLIYP